MTAGGAQEPTVGAASIPCLGLGTYGRATSWGTPQGDLKLTQQFQVVTGSLGSQAISQGKMKGDEISFKVGNTTYTGKVEGSTIRGNGPSGNWTATRKSAGD